MGRNTESAKFGYNTRAKLYSSTIVDGIEVIRKIDLQIPKIFYAKEHQVFQFVKAEFGGVMQRQAVSGYIETMDLSVGDVKIHDTVEYEGKKYNVEEVRYEDSNFQKDIRKRPVTKTIIKLGGVV